MTTPTPDHEGSGRSLLDRWTRWCVRRRTAVVLGWVVVLAGLGGAALLGGGAYSIEFEVPESESSHALAVLDERFPERSGDPLFYVFELGEGGSFDDQAVRRDVEAVIDRVAAIDGVQGVESPYDSPLQLSPETGIGFALAQLEGRTFFLEPESLDALFDAADDGDTGRVTVELGGRTLQFADQAAPGSSEAVGLVAAVVVLLLTFGSVVAMGLPLLTAGIGLGIGVSLVALMANVLTVPEFGPALAVMLGLGVGIDYALFIVTRYRQALSEGASPDRAVVEAVTTAGRAVIFAGGTVIVSLLGLLLIDIGFLRGLALGAAIAVAMGIATSISLLPAVLGLLGPNIDRLRVPGLGAADPTRESRWFRWSRFVQRRPLPVALLGLVVLLSLAVPFLSIDLGSPDASTQPTSSTTRRAYDLITEGFGIGLNGPLAVVASTGGRMPLPSLDGVVDAVNDAPGVTIAVPPDLNAAGDTAIITVIPDSGPQDAATEALIGRLRDEVLPEVTPDDVTLEVSGITAVFADLSTFLAGKLPVFMGVVLTLSFALLVAVFRSVVVPLKAVVMNLLSIGAAYGVVVAVFQWGWGASLIGLDTTGPIQPFVPIMLFAIVFGLSMDYEVFLLSRVSEEYRRTGDNALAVADGLARTARVITAAAAIMVTIFASFVFNDDTILKLFGLGLSVAILVDATLVRTILVPATMELLGDANWWLPTWIQRRLPRLGLEGPSADEAPAQAPVRGAGRPSSDGPVEGR